jgi:hypothetical protein
MEKDLQFMIPCALDPDELYATIDGEEPHQDMQLTENQAYTAIPASSV